MLLTPHTTKHKTIYTTNKRVGGVGSEQPNRKSVCGHAVEISLVCRLSPHSAPAAYYVPAVEDLASVQKEIDPAERASLAAAFLM